MSQTSSIFAQAMKNVLVVIFAILLTLAAKTQEVKIAILKYKGGGDWYANPTSLPYLVNFCNKNLQNYSDGEIEIVEVGDLEIYNFPFVHMTGHGNVIFSPGEAENRLFGRCNIGRGPGASRTRGNGPDIDPGLYPAEGSENSR